MSAMLERLAAHVARPVGESDRARAARHLADWLACVAGGLHEPLAAPARALGNPLAAAALLGNLLEMDDVHRAARLHPGPVVWPVVLAEGDDRDAMLDAAVAGYEAMIVLGRTLDDKHYAHWHPTATAGIVGAAAAAARLAGLGEGATADALGHAASLAGGLWHMRHGDSATKQVHVLHAAEAGRRCAALAAAGLTGAHGSVDGPQGLWEAMCAAPAEPAFPERWQVHDVSFKPWAGCRHIHPAIEAALDLALGVPFVPGDVEATPAAAIRVETYRDALTFCDRPYPRTPAEARFSLQHGVAIALARGVPTPADYEPQAIADLAPLRARVTVAEDPAFTAAYPAHFGARVRADGRTVTFADARGDPERPMDEAAHAAKLAALCDWGRLDPQAPQAARAAAADGPNAVRTLIAGWLA